ncbi:hypothetical protein N566_26140 [Streptomycetaceae bacterium MP113-05]|nr:hypothetical protein N566_26140 [Streptomycetaceae bacterium MP113-05]
MGEAPRSAIWDLVERENGTGAGNQDPGGQTVMSLASAGDGGSSDWASTSGSGSMKSERKLWSRAAHDVSSLEGNLKQATEKLQAGQTGFGADVVTGFVTGAEQVAVHDTWKRYLDLIQRETGELAGKLEKAGNDHYKNDEATADAFKQQQTKPEEPRPAHGGHPSTGGRSTQGE